jgi:hypothetical protein
MNSNFKELLLRLNAAGIRYLLLGGFADMKFSEPYHNQLPGNLGE